MENILNKLNDSQKQAVLYNDGPSLVIAGAGSGKTRVLTCKVAVLLKQGLAPWNIMALTFTNKAAREMKERVAGLVDPTSASLLWMGTFHSVFLRILRAEASVLGYPSSFSIYDTTDSKNMIKSIVRDLGLDEKIYREGAVHARISSAKNDLISPAAYANNPALQERDLFTKMPRIVEIYERYVQRCRLASAMDFDDLLYNTNVLFRDHPEILKAYQSRFQFILVDEYQDTNFSQHLIVSRLAERHHKVCVVGDDSQSIYSFRGANIDNILNFKKTYPECLLFKLEQNYRSTKNIVNLANSLIAKNKIQIPKSVFSKRETGNKISVLSAFSDMEEAYMIANKINEMHMSLYDPWSEFAVLYRTNAQSRILEDAMRKRGIPYRIYGGISFYQRKEIKDIIAYLRLVINPADEEAFKRVVNFPARGIGKTTLDKIQQAAALHRTTFWEICSKPLSYNLPVHSGTENKLKQFSSLIENLMPLASTLNVYEFTKKMFEESGINKALLQDSSEEGISRQEHLESLLSGMFDFCQSRLEEGNEQILLPDYLAEISLLTDQDEVDEGEKVNLMTVHAAKGLEFKNVFVSGLEDGVFPSVHNLESDRELEEERRLLYVAITRAGDHCVLSYAKSRFRNGQTEYSKPSRFLNDLDKRFLDLPTRSFAEEQETAFSSAFGSDRRFASFYNPEANSPQRTVEPYTKTPLEKIGSRQGKWSKLAARPAGTVADREKDFTAEASSTGVKTSKGEFRMGQKVLHERFGEGLIQKIEGQGDNCKIGVEFKQAGYKLLLLKFASMKAID
ncbi:MAG: ATP-dependent helicase [Bacteroidales bacterium]|nr:3'-5' exonuclease [Bacteroidota bacterium]HOD27151.1 3'-5' exonuclease [Bacteroidales bacterium]HPH57181.1 3'-5' exonuclease [Bacteroidales bacterium]HQM94047.1 3'-5' exonuclease [Bacteroidales bacterium]